MTFIDGATVTKRRN